jgi:hypothetical protein
MNEPVYVFSCEACEQYSTGKDLTCTNCGIEARRRTEVVVITDGAPSEGEDTQYAKGFRAGQEYGIGLAHRKAIRLLEAEMNGKDSWIDAIDLIKGEQK